jgi:membrane protease YdiL (CAAX protease family)
MMKSITNWTRNHSLLAYFILAYAFSWIIGIPLALKAQGIIQVQIPFSLHYLIAYGPMLSALLVTGLTSGSTGLQKLLDRITKWRVRLGWWLFAVTPFVFYFLAATVLWVIQGNPINLNALGEIDFLPPLGLISLPLWILTFGIGEETGWRGFALPRLQKGRSALSATVILWIVWAFWHLPLFFYSYPISVLPGFLIGLLAGSITFTWLYNSTKGSVLMTALWHGAFNFTTACVSCKAGVGAAAVSTAVMIWAVLIVLIFKTANLSNSRKQVI